MRSRRGNEASQSDNSDVSTPVAEDKDELRSSPSSEKSKIVSLSLSKLERFRIAIILLVILASTLILYRKGYHQPLNWWLLLGGLSIPVILLMLVVAGYFNSLPHQRWIALGTVNAVLAKQLPSSISVLSVFVLFTLFHLASRPLSVGAPEPGRLKAAVAAIFMAVIFIFDNFSVWVVAATYEQGITGTPEPLQDNGKILQQFLLTKQLGLAHRSIVAIRSILNVQWALAASLAMTFGVVDLQLVKGRTVWGMALRALLMLAALRVIRVLSFLMTVLPSQNPHCFGQRFPSPPPADWLSWIEVGLRPQSNGGCNDLIVSGHATVLTTFACVSASIAGHPVISMALWSMLATDFLLEVYEGFHYSVDMWMGALIGTMMWRVLAPLEQVDPNTTLTGHKQLKPLSSTTLAEVGTYAIPAVAAYVNTVFVPHSRKEYAVFGFLGFAILEAVRKGFTHYLQHVLICCLLMALGIWL